MKEEPDFERDTDNPEFRESAGIAQKKENVVFEHHSSEAAGHRSKKFLFNELKLLKD